MVATFPSIRAACQGRRRCPRRWSLSAPYCLGWLGRSGRGAAAIGLCPAGWLAGEGQECLFQGGPAQGQPADVQAGSSEPGGHLREGFPARRRPAGQPGLLPHRWPVPRVPSEASAAASCRGSSPGGDCRSSRSPPARALSWPGVPLAMTWPWSMMTIVPASRSASSMYWVVSSRLVPCAVRSLRTCHNASRPRGSRPVVGSSRNSTGGAASRLAATSRRRRMPPE